MLVFNRGQQRAKDLQEQLPRGSILIADSIQDAVAQADIVFTCLSDDDAVKTVYDVMLASEPAGKLFVECSTIYPSETKGLSERVCQAGARFVACPGMYGISSSTTDSEN